MIVRLRVGRVRELVAVVANHTDDEWEAKKERDRLRDKVSGYTDRGKSAGGFESDLEAAEKRAKEAGWND